MSNRRLRPRLCQDYSLLKRFPWIVEHQMITSENILYHSVLLPVPRWFPHSEHTHRPYLRSHALARPLAIHFLRAHSFLHNHRTLFQSPLRALQETRC